MPSLITEGRVNLIDLTDRGTLTAYVNTNQPHIQTYDQDSGVYSPDYTDTPLVITPVVFMDETPIALTDSNLSIVWKRKVGSTEYDLGTGESVTDGVLTVSVNLLNNVTPYIVYNAHISYTDSINDYTITTETSTDISLVTSGSIGNSVVFTLYAPEGTVFTNGQGSRRIQTSAYYGSTAITTGAVYKWYDYTSGSWNLISGETDDYLIVYGRDIVGQGSFKCVMTYQGADYTDVITLIDKVDNYQTDIDSTNGNMFKNSAGYTCLVAWLSQKGFEVDSVKCPYSSFSKLPPSNPNVGDFYHRIIDNSNTMPLMRYNGTTWIDVTDNIEYSYEKVYTWYRRDSDGNAMDNGQPFATGKVIYVDNDAIENGKCTFVCEVKNNSSSPIISKGNYTIIDVTDPIISSSAPLNPYEEMVWIDTSTSPSVMKIYRNGSWTVVGASDDNKSKIFTVTPTTPYKVGDLWVGRQDGEIYVCNNSRSSGNFNSGDWIPASDYQTNADVLDELDNFSSTVIDPLVTKIDNKIETWSQNTDPSSQWVDTTSDPPVDERSEHIGDLWYNSTNGSISLKRYQKISSDPDVYEWQNIQNQDAINALNGLSGKITTYSQNDTPTGSNIVEGDLWIETDNNNKLYRYNGSTWVPVTDNSGLQSFISNVYTGDLRSLQNNIDSKVETWFQSTDPSSNWYDDSVTPAVDVRSSHIGDMWFDNTPGNVKLQRYTYSLATGYVWQEITNQDAINAYSRAGDAIDLADSKRRVFYGASNPTPPYDIGDLWAQGENGSLLVCINAKEEGSTYSEDDWGDSSRYDQFMNVTYVQDKEVLQSQIDGKIQTWFQDLDPVNYAGIVSLTYPNNLSIGISSDGTWYREVDESGTYSFIYDGTKWNLNGSEISLGRYGIQIIVGTPESGDTITVVYDKPEDSVPWTTAVSGKHSGDLWYSPSKHEMKRYVDYGSNVFGWSLIQDSDALQALQDAATAQSTADGKCMTFYIKNALTYSSSQEITASIVESEWNHAVYESGTYVFSYDGSKWVLNSEYVNLDDYGIKILGDPVYGSTVTVNYTFNHPNPPYDIGDLWVQGDSGEILVCAVAKISGQSYSWDDWDYGNALNEFINVTYRNDMLDLEGLIDSKIETWFQVTDPQGAWINVDIKNAHKGDIWYKDDLHIYRYSNDRTWIQYNDTNDPPESGQTIGPIRQAYITAANARDTKDGKRRVFIGPNNPVPPYDRGDIWMQGTNNNTDGRILYCNTARLDGGTYVSGDFVVASKYQEYQIEVGTTPPADTMKMWLDITDSSKPVLKRYDNTTSSWTIVGVSQNIHTGSTPPTPPYDAGNMWVYYDDQGNVGIRVCITSKESGNYDPNDWVEGDSEIIVRSDTEPDHNRLWYNVTNNILYMYDYDSSKWVEVGDLSSVADITAKNNVSIISLNKNMSRVLDATYTLDVVSSNTSRFSASLDKSLWMNGNSSDKSPSPYANVYGELVYAYGPAIWGTFIGYKSGNVVSGEVNWSQIANNGNHTWAYYHDTKWRKRFEQESIVGSSGSNSDMANNEYINIIFDSTSDPPQEGPQSGDYVTLKNYSTNTSLGFVVSDYYEEYQYVEGELTSIGNKVEVISTAFSFESNGLHIFDGRQDVSDPSELVLGHSQVTLGYRKGGAPDITIDHDGVTAPHLTATLTLDVRNTIILGKYKLDCSFVNKTAGVTISYVG